VALVAAPGHPHFLDALTVRPRRLRCSHDRPASKETAVLPCPADTHGRLDGTQHGRGLFCIIQPERRAARAAHKRTYT